MPDQLVLPAPDGELFADRALRARVQQALGAPQEQLALYAR